MRSLLTTLKESAQRLVSKFLPGLLRGSGEQHEAVETRSRSDAGSNPPQRGACGRAEPERNLGYVVDSQGCVQLLAEKTHRKFIQRHGSSYRVRIQRRGLRHVFGPYKSLLTAVRVRNKVLRAWDMEVPD